MNDSALTAEQIKQVKGLGFLHNRGTRTFSGRIITENGMITAQQMAVLSQAAERFGNGTVTFTVRMTLELPGIPFEQIDAFRAFVGTAGLTTGGTGARVRPIVACKGTTCVFGLCDTQGMAAALHKRFYEGCYDIALPHKFKITVGGCPNNCAKPDLNDIGIVGQRVIPVDAAVCRGCKRCGIAEACPMGAATLVDGKIAINADRCNHCGRCLGRCPFHLADGCEDRFKLYLGGRWGKKTRVGTPLGRLFTREEAMDTVERALLLFRHMGLPGERFGEMVERLGVSETERLLFSEVLPPRP